MYGIRPFLNVISKNDIFCFTSWIPKYNTIYFLDLAILSKIQGCFSEKTPEKSSIQKKRGNIFLDNFFWILPHSYCLLFFGYCLLFFYFGAEFFEDSWFEMKKWCRVKESGFQNVCDNFFLWRLVMNETITLKRNGITVVYVITSTLSLS